MLECWEKYCWTQKRLTELLVVISCLGKIWKLSNRPEKWNEMGSTRLSEISKSASLMLEGSRHFPKQKDRMLHATTKVTSVHQLSITATKINWRAFLEEMLWRSAKLAVRRLNTDTIRFGLPSMLFRTCSTFWTTFIKRKWKISRVVVTPTPVP